MATATLQHSTTEQSVSERATPVAAPLLVATDASPGSDAALRAARAIARRSGQPVKLLAVCPPIPAAAEVVVAGLGESDARSALEIAVETQLDRLGILAGGPDAQWSLEILVGNPGAAIAAAARRHDAELIIMGLGGHALTDRILGDELVLKVLRYAERPVLAVAPTFHGLPHHVLAAVDFSASSARAIAAAARLMVQDGRVTLAHVVNPKVGRAAWRPVDTGYVGTVGRGFDRLIADTDTPVGVRFERVVLPGDPAEQLLQLSRTTAPDLVVAGSHGHDLITRLLIGTVSTTLVRHSGRSVLIAPPTDGPPLLDELADERGRFASYEWRERLEEFTRRNAGRRSVMEVIDPEMGAQLEEKGVTFVGVSFDPHDVRVHIMCGGGSAGAGHLTRSISGVKAIQVLRDSHGSDVLLRIAHGRGQTLLTLER